MNKEKLQSELSDLRSAYTTLQDDYNRVVGELAIEKGRGITTLNDYREECKMRLEAESDNKRLRDVVEGIQKCLNFTPVFNEHGDMIYWMVMPLDRDVFDELIASLERGGK